MTLSRGDNNEREKKISSGEKKVPFGTVKAVAVAERINMVSEPGTKDVGAGGVADLAWLLRKVSIAALVILKVATKPRTRLLNSQMFIERSVIDCRFFALLAVAGSLLGSVLCFLEGFLLVIESYVRYFNMLSQNSDKGHMVQLLIEAIDMFLVGTALLVFGMGVHVMFVGSNHLKAKGPLPVSNLFGLFPSQESSKMGVHAISYTSEVENRACYYYDTASGSVGKIQECSSGYWAGSCLFWGRNISFFSLCIPPLSTVYRWRCDGKVAEKSQNFSSKTDQPTKHYTNLKYWKI